MKNYKHYFIIDYDYEEIKIFADFDEATCYAEDEVNENQGGGYEIYGAVLLGEITIPERPKATFIPDEKSPHKNCPYK